MLLPYILLVFLALGFLSTVLTLLASQIYPVLLLVFSLFTAASTAPQNTFYRTTQQQSGQAQSGQAQSGQAGQAVQTIQAVQTLQTVEENVTDEDDAEDIQREHVIQMP